MTSYVDRQQLVEQAHSLCRESGASLLYLTLFGSSLYGMEMPGKSDLDLRGIFLPSLEFLALDKAPRSLHFSTAGGNERRRMAGDVDIDLWSAQHWLLKLLPDGDIGALDLLFSPAHAACVLYRHPALDAAFANPLRLFNTGRDGDYARYSLGQAKKYGIRGSRLGAFKAVRGWLRAHCPELDGQARLIDYLDALVQVCGNSPFCALENIQGKKMLQLGGKLHDVAISMAEFSRRVEADLAHYGGRAETAEQGQDLDFKALSHALRALDQMEELLLTGKIVFPLRGRAELLNVKEGKYAWSELEPRILRRIAEVDALHERAPFAGRHDSAFAESLILSCYNRELAART